MSNGEGRRSRAGTEELSHLPELSTTSSASDLRRSATPPPATLTSGGQQRDAHSPSPPSATKAAPSSSSGGFWKRRNKAPGVVQQAQRDASPQPQAAMPASPVSDQQTPNRIRKRSSSSTGFSSLLPSSLTDLLYRNESPSPRKNAERFRQSAPEQLAAHQSPEVLHISSDSVASTAARGASSPRESVSRQAQFERLLAAHNIDLAALRKLGWKGVPEPVRAAVWRLLVGYVPTNADRRAAVLARKRREYHEQAATVEVADSERSPSDLTMWKQISIDMPRTHPTVKLFQDTLVQELHRRLLFLWAVRHPASGYVQGINDLATPFFVVFLAAELGIGIGELCQRTTIGDVPLDVRQRVEADTYWCFSRLLDGIQDHYTFAQPGIQRMVHKLHDVVARVDRPLSQHLASQDCQFIQFSFRWFNCLLMRELRLHHIVRMWDSYLCDDSAECGGFASFHAYVCAAFLCSWSRQLRQLDFQEIMLFLQRLPTDDWTEDNIDVLLSQAFVWFSLFEGAQAHLGPTGERERFF